MKYISSAIIVCAAAYTEVNAGGLAPVAFVFLAAIIAMVEREGR